MVTTRMQAILRLPETPWAQPDRKPQAPRSPTRTAKGPPVSPQGKESIGESNDANACGFAASLEEDPDGDYHDDGPARNAGRSLNAGGSGRPNKKQKRSGRQTCP